MQYVNLAWISVIENSILLMLERKYELVNSLIKNTIFAVYFIRYGNRKGKEALLKPSNQNF